MSAETTEVKKTNTKSVKKEETTSLFVAREWFEQDRKPKGTIWDWFSKCEFR